MEVAPKDPAAGAEEEAVKKKNTDCVYFLASPFTCKKGSECEYRHSDAARMNPRDCWYWLNSNCLNPKCSYRHPPLDAFLGNKSTTTVGGSQMATSQPAAGGSQMATSQPAASMPAPVLTPVQGKAAGAAPQVGSKQSVPCYYFQQGYCMKGDRCPFMHGPQPAAGLAPAPPPPPPKIAATYDESAQPHMKIAAPLQKCSAQNQISQTSSGAGIMTTESELIRTPATKRSAVADLIQDHRAPIPEPINDFAVNGNPGGSLSSHLSQLEDEHYSNGLEAGEILRESSPGFDVLVDHTENGEYYRDEEEFGQNVEYGGKHLSSVDENQYRRYVDLDADYGREQYHLHTAGDRFDWEPSNHPSSHRRTSERSSTRESRGLRRARSPERVSRSDLRHQLSKQRRIDGVPQSDHGNNYRRERERATDRRYESRSGREQQPLSKKNNISSRLQGRLKLPEAENNERGIDRRRVSPSKQNSVEQGRLLNDILRQSGDVAGRNERNSTFENDEVNKTVDFAGPKSLAELKGAKGSERKEVLTGKSNNSTAGVRSGKTLESLGSDSIPFEGPKPLSEILKRKRDMFSAVNGSESTSGEAKNQVESGEKKTPEASPAYEENGVSGDQTVSVPEDGLPSSEQELAKSNDLEAGDDDQAEGEQVEEGEEYDYYYEGDEEYEYEETETGNAEYETETGNAEHEEHEGMDVDEECLGDDEDGEDFAAKIKAIIH